MGSLAILHFTHPSATRPMLRNRKLMELLLQQNNALMIMRRIEVLLFCMMLAVVTYSQSNNSQSREVFMPLS